MNDQIIASLKLLLVFMEMGFAEVPSEGRYT
jgi:hypothetical protein